MNLEVSPDLKSIIPAEKLNSIVQAFGEIDLNGDGKIQLEEYLKFALTEETNRLMKEFKTIDTDGDGFIDFEEFVATREPNLNLLKKFRQLDIDKNGLLSVDEAVNIAESLVLPVSSDRVKEIVQQADGDGDGQVSYYEYLGAIASIGFQ